MKTGKHLIGFLIFGLMVYALSGCVVRPTGARPAPPPARVEVIPRQPSPRHNWVSGHYRWHRGHYDWVPGHYRRGRRY
ncbi:MAG: hypothetical protein U0X91_08355 [Spirosomataceae bacterium]